MNASLVERLAQLQSRNARDLDDKARNRFAIQYNADVGWCMVNTYARERKTFPLPVIGRDRWLFIAYMAILNPAVHSSRDVEDARELRLSPSLSAKLNALLMAGLGQPADEHLSLVAEKTGIPKPTVEAYEVLFFNVLDRAADHAYISHVVYPDSRVVELDEDYFDKTPIADLLLRAAFNHRDIDLVLRLTGMTDEACRQELATLGEQQKQLETSIMGNALLMSKMGLLNQRSAGLNRASTLLAASSATPTSVNPPEPEVPHDLAGELAAALASVPPLTPKDRADLRAAARPGSSYWHDEEGNIMPVDYAEFSPNPRPPASAPSAPLAPFVKFPDPVSGIWRNKDSDNPVVIVARMSEPGLPDHYLTAEGVGLPVSEVFFGN
jgi:hypothetical protein